MRFSVILRATVIAVLAIAGASQALAAAPLPKLKVDTSKTTVSGLSSGAFMANQLGYAYSATFKGVGVFVGRFSAVWVIASLLKQADYPPSRGILSFQRNTIEPFAGFQVTKGDGPDRAQ